MKTFVLLLSLLLMNACGSRQPDITNLEDHAFSYDIEIDPWNNIYMEKERITNIDFMKDRKCMVIKQQFSVQAYMFGYFRIVNDSVLIQFQDTSVTYSSSGFNAPTISAVSFPTIGISTLPLKDLRFKLSEKENRWKLFNHEDTLYDKGYLEDNIPWKTVKQFYDSLTIENPQNIN